MAGTLSEAHEMYALYIAAEKAVLQGQSYTIKDRTLTRANLSTIISERKKWCQQVQALSGNGSIRTRRAVIRDS